MQKFATPAPVTAVLGIPAGTIRLVASDRADTTVEIRPVNPLSKRDVKLAGQLTATCDDGVLRIQSPAGNRIMGSSGAVEVTVELPAGSRVDAKTASAEFRTEGPLGEVSYTSSQGPVEVGHAATARITTSVGDITVGRLDGDALIRTAKGGIQVAEAAHGALDLRTETGAISVGAAAGVSASLDAGTARGRIRNALMNSDATPGLDIHATTSLGDITAHSL